MSIKRSAAFKRLSERIDHFAHSWAFIAVVTAIGALGFIFQYEVEAMYAIGVLGIINLIFIRSLLPNFLILAIIAMNTLDYKGDYEQFKAFYYSPLLVAPAFFFHLYAFKPKLYFGRFFYTTLAVAVAVTLGGIGVVTFGDYFSLPVFYYTFVLGFGMLFVYILIEAYIPGSERDTAAYFSKMMVGIGLMGIAMVTEGVITEFEYFQGAFGTDRPFQWRNNLSQMLLLSMPFAFYLSVTNKHNMFYLSVGIFQFFAMLLSLSRGGIVFGGFEFPVLLLGVFVFAKGKRVKLAATTIFTTGGFLLVFHFFATPLDEVYRNIYTLMLRGSTSRIELFREAWRVFLEHPVLGAGIAYPGEGNYGAEAIEMYWFHSTFFQVIGSMGTLGFLAYAYQEIERLKTLFERIDLFNMTTLIAFAGFAGYSMVNIGYFVPMPFVAMVITMFVVVDRRNRILGEVGD